MRRLIASACLVLAPCLLPAQGTQATVPPLDFSGVLFGNFGWRTDDAAKLQTGGKALSKFDVGRAYLTFRMAAGDRGSVRVTTDIFQQSPSAYYAGWTVRLKYGYFQYDFTKNLAGVQGLSAIGRIGMLHTVVVDHIENFWPRYLGQVGEEQNGYFSSADVGAASLVTMPNKRGEVYVTVVNGTNYSSGETDRFKDFAARVTFTPLANGTSIFKTLVISPWYSKGWTASAFTAPPNAISDGLQKDRRGIFVGVRDRALTGGLDWSQRLEGIETAAPPARTTDTRTSNLASIFALFRPMELIDSKKKSSLGVIARWDKFDSYSKNSQLGALNTVADNTYIVGGLFWDLNARAQIALDYQEMKATTTVSTFPTKTLFLHWQTTF